MNKNVIGLLLVGLGLATTGACAQIRGAGSLFAARLYESWGKTLASGGSGPLTYDAVGSVAGVRALQSRTVDFGASDQPLTKQQLEQAGAVQFPTAVGGVVVTANLPGIDVSALQLDGPTLAAIYLGTIRTWNDPALRALNPDLPLPAVPITPVFRSDGAGASTLFTSYLAKVSEPFRKGPAAASELSVPGGRAAKSSADALRQVGTTVGTIAYIDYTAAAEAGVATVRLKNRWGRAVAANRESLQMAMGEANWERMLIDQDPTFELDITDAPCPACWPIAGTTYVLLPVRGRAANSVRVLDFFEQALQAGDAQATGQGYVPLPNQAKNLVTLAMRRWRSGLEHPAPARAAARPGDDRPPAAVSLR